MIKSKLLALFLFLISSTTFFAQNSLGVLQHNDALAFKGYNLFFPHFQKNVYLIDNCGRIINQWNDTTYNPGNSVHLLENGNIVKAGGRGQASNQWIHAGGGGEVVQIKDWEDNLLWQFVYNDSLKRLHHDIVPMPNGNILMVAWELKTKAEAVEAGRDTTLIPDGTVWPDHIIEVEPIGSDSGNIVWEWHAWDHLIQDYDPSKANYGVVADHSELININYDDGEGEADWMHVNAIDYNPFLNQIIISVPSFGEFWIIDHSTTTEQAAGHSGGAGGMGGDLMYRWGNPQTYNQGTEEDRKLDFQHDVHWVDLSLTPSHPDFGKVALFNNRIGGDYSTANLLIPTWDMYSWSYLLSGNIYGPSEFNWTYTAPTPTDLFSSGLSSVQRLENGNTLICSGRQGRIFEITPMEEVVWEYENPLVQGAIGTNGLTDPADNQNLVFRFNRYPIDYPAFDGRILDPSDYIELEPDTTLCPNLTTGVFSVNKSYDIVTYPNPTSDYLIVKLMEEGKGEVMKIYNTVGQFMFEKKLDSVLSYIDLSTWANGMYFIEIKGQHVGRFIIAE